MKQSQPNLAPDAPAAASRLAELFARNGCARTPNISRRRKEGKDYKKGYEIRLVANGKVELRLIRRCLSLMGFKAGKPYAKGRRLVQTIYGKRSWQRFRELVRRQPVARRAAAKLK